MRTSSSKKGLPLLAGALFALAVCAPAGAGFAQTTYGGGTSQLMSRLDQLENQIQTLSRSVYRGETVPMPSAPAPSYSGGGEGLASFEARLSQIEQQQRQLTGQVEQALHVAQEAQNRLDKLQADYDMRLQQLEGGGAVSSPPSTGGGQQPSTYAVPEHTLGTMSSSGATGTADALYESAFADIRNSKYDAAEGKFRQFLSAHPGNPLAGNAQYWLAETYYVRGDYQQSAKAFAQGYQDYPKGPKAADSLLKLGLSLSRLNRKEDACLSFQQLKKEFPGENIPANRRATQEMKTLGCN